MKLSKRLMNQKGVVSLILLIAVVGFILFLVVVSTISFNSKVFDELFPKPRSHAASNPISGPIKIPGDINEDNIVDIIDYGIFVGDFGTRLGVELRSDINKDGAVNIIDYGIFVDNFGKSVTASGGAEFSLVPQSGTYNRNCRFAVDINLDTNGSMSDGADAVLTFPIDKMSVVSITPGRIYPDYPTLKADNNLGKISITALSSPGSNGFAGKGKFATLNLKMQPFAGSGGADLIFDFDPANPQKTSDSNVPSTFNTSDLLRAVHNGVYLTGSGASCS